jgi:hypothetical protein
VPNPGNQQLKKIKKRKEKTISGPALLCTLRLISLERAYTIRAPAKQGNQNGNSNKQTVVYNSSFHFD